MSPSVPSEASIPTELCDVSVCGFVRVRCWCGVTFVPIQAANDTGSTSGIVLSDPVCAIAFESVLNSYPHKHRYSTRKAQFPANTRFTW